MLTWGEPDKRLFAHGIDRGVLYPSKFPVGDILAVNDAFNPRAVAGANTWVTNAGTGGVVTNEDFANGGWNNLPYHKSTWTTAPTAGNPRIEHRPRDIAVVAGEKISVSIRGWSNVKKDCRLTIDFYTAADAFVSVVTSTLVAPDANVWTLFKKENITVPATATKMRVYFARNSGTLVGEAIAATALQVNRGAVVQPYLDGSLPEDTHSYEWSGTPNASQSIERAIEGRAIAWNGITGFDEGVESGATTIMYRDGIIYLADVDASDFSGRLTTLFYPEEFGECVGIPRATDGLYVDNQKPQPFAFSYRTLVGSGARGDMFGYQIHLVYNCMATISTRSRKSIGGASTPVEFGFDIVCTPVKLAGYRPTAHYIIDTRDMSDSTVAQLEAILYGSPTQAPRMPTPQELYDMMNFGDAITVTVHTDGTFTVIASNDNLQAIDDNHFVMKNINGSDNGDGTYVISDGGTTDVILE